MNEIYTTMALCPNLNIMAQKKPPQKLERRRSICVDTIGEMQEKGGIEE